ncbi:type IX secretion system membrane protein PorP/SprF [Echinicola sp. CAU 1574]|uniref:Type IX secretion system membrane protein PorP/SprF n=1 Tax=Echinicola arenosa TaxID=2774144 RepID=A0ABR9AGB8_9BACT|nr:type IX secretion system membrane protein PorP/SprF [Echinicola arenosa]MBD8487796.1 type IX secretion system membrane protein PorP/SprF [Echinicola arenosa]
MKSLKYILIAAGILFGCYDVQAQQAPVFSQYMFNPLFINPAYAGYKQQIYLQSYYRKQWSNVPGSPETFAISGDGLLTDTNVGVGGHIMVDRLGAQKTTGGYANAAYHLRVSGEGYISFGLGAGMVNTKLDGSMLNPMDPSDPSVSTGDEQVLYPDLRAGLFYYNPYFFAGISADNMFSSSFNFDNGAVLVQPNSNLYLTAGTLIDVSYNVALKPSIMYVDDFAGPSRLDLNAFVLLSERLWLGASYRTSVNFQGEEFRDNEKRPVSIVGLVEFYVNDQLRIGYAYDHNVSGFSTKAFSTHDFSVGFLFPPKRVKLVSPRYF